MEKQLDIYKFDHYRNFLLRSFEQKKKINNSWSYGAWAKKLGLKDNSSLLKIINGQREAGPKITSSLIEYFKFNTAEAEYFTDLVQLSKLEKNPQLKMALLDKIRVSINKPNFKQVDEDLFNHLADWWHLPLHLLLKIKPQLNDPGQISKHFIHKVTPSQIKKALSTLTRLGMVEKRGEHYQASCEQLKTSDDIPSEAIKLFHENMLTNASESLRKTQPIHREIAADTLIINKDDLPEAKEFLRQAMDTFRARFADKDQAKDIYQLQVQLFPLIQSGDKNEIAH